MRKTIFTLSFILATALAFSQTKTVDVEKSTIRWVGKKITGQHEGFINLKSGELEMNENKITGGYFVVDMESLYCTDLEGESKGNLEGHLKSDDFFGVEKHPEASFRFTNVKANENGDHEITGNLTIKGITKTQTLVLSMAENKTVGTMVIDRTAFNVRYGSGKFFSNLGDRTIDDNFQLIITLIL